MGVQGINGHCGAYPHGVATGSLEISAAEKFPSHDGWRSRNSCVFAPFYAALSLLTVQNYFLSKHSFRLEVSFGRKKRWMPSYQQAYQAARRRLLRQCGLCVDCGKAEAQAERTRCRRCALYASERTKHWLRKRTGTVQQSFGHSDRESTMRYLKPSRSQQTREKEIKIFA